MAEEQHRYRLDIFEPGSTENAWMRFSSPTPFMSINVGDLINPSIWPETGAHLLEVIQMMRVVNLEHVVWLEKGQVNHTTFVYTEQVEDIEEVKLGRGQQPGLLGR